MAVILSGLCRYIHSPMRRVDIPKPQGGVRTFAISTMTDRLIQQALHRISEEIQCR